MAGPWQPGATRVAMLRNSHRRTARPATDGPTFRLFGGCLLHRTRRVADRSVVDVTRSLGLVEQALTVCSAALASLRYRPATRSPASTGRGSPGADVACHTGAGTGSAGTSSSDRGDRACRSAGQDRYPRRRARRLVHAALLVGAVGGNRPVIGRADPPLVGPGLAPQAAPGEVVGVVAAARTPRDDVIETADAPPDRLPGEWCTVGCAGSVFDGQRSAVVATSASYRGHDVPDVVGGDLSGRRARQQPFCIRFLRAARNRTARTPARRGPGSQPTMCRAATWSWFQCAPEC
jgi:hypothetical protein